MRREYITEGELMAELRKHGIDDVRRVSRAYIEATGNVSVLLQGPFRRRRGD